MLNFHSSSAAVCHSVTANERYQDLLADVVQPPVRYTGLYDVADPVPYYNGTSSTVGVVTAECNSSTSGSAAAAAATVTKTLHCSFDYTDGNYKLVGDSMECAGAC